MLADWPIFGQCLLALYKNKYVAMLIRYVFVKLYYFYLGIPFVNPGIFFAIKNKSNIVEVWMLVVYITGSDNRSSKEVFSI